MKALQILLTVVLTVSVGTAAATKSHGVKGYVKKDGTYVAPHRATDPNKTKIDNYSTKGNTNPYTGKEGKKPESGSR